jgi:hypothetical protein
MTWKSVSAPNWRDLYHIAYSLRRASRLVRRRRLWEAIQVFTQRSGYSESDRLANIAALEAMLTAEANRSARMAQGAAAMVRSYELATDMPSWRTDTAVEQG